MNLVSWCNPHQGTSGITATDLSLVDFAKYMGRNWGQFCYMSVVIPISEQDFQRWKADGLPVLSRQSIALAAQQREALRRPEVAPRRA